MKLTVLVDNNTFIDKYFYGEPALSYYIEDEETKLLFDAGYSDLFIKNALQLDIDLSQLSAVVISHGHEDHTGGLPHFLNKYNMRSMKIVAHPEAFCDKILDGMHIGSPIEDNELRKCCDLQLTATPVQLSKNMIFLGEIPPSNGFEVRKAIGKRKKDNGYVDDFVKEDSALVYHTGAGIYIVTGCSRSGICNIIEYAKKVCACNNVAGVIGGFHLFEKNCQLQETINYFLKNDIQKLYPCHCVSLAAKTEISRHIPVNEVGVGMEIVW